MMPDAPPSGLWMSMTTRARSIVESKLFGAIIVAVILFAGVLVGIETSAPLMAAHGGLLRILDAVVLIIFVAEIALKIIAHENRPLHYFRDGWNVFDFTIVLLCLLPVGGQFASVLRLARTLRLLRLISALPKLQLLVGALLKSLSSMGYVGLLLGLVFYIYAITGIHLFGNQAPENFGNLRAALMSLFQMITLDNWREMYDSARSSAPVAATLYFVSFILLGTMIMLNLFIGIVMNSMSEMHREMDEQNKGRSSDAANGSVLSDISALDGQLTALRLQLDALRAKLTSSNP